MHAQPGVAHGDHGIGAHKQYRLADGVTVPEVSLQVLQDPKSGFNIHIQTKHFRFAPEHASQRHVDGEGHAHLYINGKKVARVYGEWFHVDSISSGHHEILVTLNTNDHRDYADDEGTIHAVQTLVVP